MDDLISRQAAIDKAIMIPVARIVTEDKMLWRKAVFVEDIEALPSAQPGWIPVTERLPKKDGDYLVTTHSGQIARYIFIGGSSEEYWRRCATAWMPLPQPYKEAQNDER